MDTRDLPQMLRRVRKACRAWREPVVTQISRKRDPFRVLVSCLLSLRTRDEVTEAASKRLFALAGTPKALLKLPDKKLQEAIYPVAFYRNKTKSLKALCRRLLEDHGGRVPDTLEDLLDLPGVGRKTANLTLTLGFDKPGICVDTHVHRISNRWGLVETRTPEETEGQLREKLPKRYWKEYNDLLVCFGRNCCTPLSPRCSACPVETFCEKRGVVRHR